MSQRRADSALTGPATGAQRSTAVDALRGVAILGILAVNILYFALGFAYEGAGDSALDRTTRALVRVLCEAKFITIFSMLFGAGIVMMDRSARARDERWTARFLRRHAALLVIGLLHAYLLWYGDILVTYALIGFCVFWLRRLDAKWLALIGATLFLLGWLTTSWLWSLDSAAGTDFEGESAAARGSFLDRAAFYALFAFIYQSFILVLFSSWFNGGLMLIGMALAKVGFFTGERSTRLYASLAIITPIVVIPAIALAHATIPEGRQFTALWMYVNTALAPCLSLAYASATILLATRARAHAVLAPFAAVGRTALSNYILQSVACVWIFYAGLGGLGLFPKVHEAGALGIGLVIAGAQLIISPLWLRVFRFGPLEWLWRTVTYGRPQPMLRPSTPT